jgi:catechol-2,3-dioxygenase
VHIVVSFRANRDVAFEVRDLAHAEQFYSGVMGLDLVERRDGTLVYNAGYLTLHIKESVEPHPPVLSFGVLDLAEAREHLVENGCEIVVEWGRSLYFRDPFGVVHDIIEERKRAL